MLALTGGAIAGVDAAVHGQNIEKSIARGMIDSAIVAATTAINPIGTLYGIGRQLLVDTISGEASSPEAYTASALTGAIAMSGIPFANMVAGGTGAFANDSLTNMVGGGNISVDDTFNHVVSSVFIGAIFDVTTPGLSGGCKIFDDIQKSIRWLVKPFKYLKSQPSSFNPINTINGLFRTIGIRDGYGLMMSLGNSLVTSKVVTDEKNDECEEK